MQILLVVLTVLLAGCSQERSSRDVFNNYLYRLSNSLDVEREDKPVIGQLARYPRKPEISYEIPRITVNLLEFLRLADCELQRLIGHRNSSLGRLMTGYQSLLYEYKFLRLAAECQATLPADSALHSALDEAIAHKQRYQKQLQWNAVFSSDEMKQLFSLSGTILASERLANNPTELIQALETIKAWLSEPGADEQRLLYAYQTLATARYIGELRITMSLAVATLDRADRLIEQRLTDNPLCVNQQGNPRFQVVNRVFHKFYIGEVQPILAKLNQQGKQIFTGVDQLQSSFPPNPAFTEYWNGIYRSDGSEWAQFNQAVSSHTRNWQVLLRQCGSMPGGPTP